MSARVDLALRRARDQSAHGPRFDAGMCKRETRELYGVPSDGSASAAESWARAQYKHTDGSVPPPGALVWWLGGADGHGHVGSSAGERWCWSVDILRTGFWDLVPIAKIDNDWPALRYVGWTEDIDGVRVITVRPPKPADPTRIERSRRLLQKALARATGNRANKIRAALKRLPTK